MFLEMVNVTYKIYKDSELIAEPNAQFYKEAACVTLFEKYGEQIMKISGGDSFTWEAEGWEGE